MTRMTATASLPIPTVRPPRLASLDAFRGFTIVGMLWVNNLGATSSVPHQFGHAAWGAFPTFCDMIFPWFLLIVGVALPFAKASRLKRGVSRPRYYLGAFRRMAMLMMLGWLINSSGAKRISIGLDVLQLIGLAYLTAALFDDFPRRVRIAIIAGLFLWHWTLLRFIPIPGMGAGVFEHDRNAITYINSHLEPYHIRGFFSTFPTAALVMIGAFVGDMLRNPDMAPSRKSLRVAALGAVMIVIGLIWHLDLPMNKTVWTPPYLLFAGGIGCVILALFHQVIDVAGLRRWAFPLVVFGMNAITVYVLSILVRLHVFLEWNTTLSDGTDVNLWTASLRWFESSLGVPTGGMVMIALYIAAWWLVMYWMYRRNIFWRV